MNCYTPCFSDVLLPSESRADYSIFLLHSLFSLGIAGSELRSLKAIAHYPKSTVYWNSSKIAALLSSYFSKSSEVILFHFTGNIVHVHKNNIHS